MAKFSSSPGAKIFIFNCGDEQKIIQGYYNISLNIEEEVRIVLRIAADCMNEKNRSKNTPLPKLFRRLSSKSRYKTQGDNDEDAGNTVITDDDVLNSQIEVDQDGGQTIVTLSLRSCSHASEWFQQILKTFTVHQLCFMAGI